MSSSTEKQQPEREHTDQSLLVERVKSDKALMEKRAVVEEEADDQVEHARDQADAVLDKARVAADEVIATDKPTGVGPALAREREKADRILQKERAAADERLQADRREQAAALAALLPLEREKTDRSLLTERTRSDRALAQRDDFMGMVSHDLRNLLHGIVLNTNLLSGKASDSEEGRRTVEGMQKIQRYVARMNRLIGDLLDVVSLDAGQLMILPEAGDAATLLAEAVNAYAHTATDKQLTLAVEVIEPPLEAEFDHERMLQVLSNLLSNAIKFTPEGGTISVRAECSAHALSIVVSDTGKGIPDDQLETVFERFWQGGKDERRGVGLGLYISRCIVEAHDGSLRAESAVGEGSVFHLDIPRRSRSTGSKAASAID